MRSIGGTIDIQRGGIWFYASGAGLVGDGKWDGTILVTDVALDWDIIEIGFDGASDFVSFEEEQETRITSDGSTRITSYRSTRII